MSSFKERVVITGLGVLTPLGNDVETYWNNLKLGTSGANVISRFDTTNFKTKFACELKDFNAEDYIHRKEVRKMDLFSVYGIASAMQAIQDAGIESDTINKNRVGVIWGSGIGGIGTLQKEAENFVETNRTPKFNPFFIPKLIVDIVAGHISMKYGFKGPNYVTVSACASSTNALIDGLMQIQLGKADIIVSGGSESAITELGMGGFNALRALSTRNDDPKTASRAFDQNRDGFVMGEGAGCLVLEELEHAKKRGAKIYAEVIGGGLSADAHHLTAPHPEGEGAMNAMNLAIEDAGISSEEIDYINVHGTSTPLGDVAELKAIEKVFGDHAYNLNISSTKSMTGHLLGAAGAIEAIACVMAVKHNIVPPSINIFDLDENINPKLNLTINKAQEREVNVALSNTFGFGGHNTSLIVKKYT